MAKSLRNAARKQIKFLIGTAAVVLSTIAISQVSAAKTTLADYRIAIGDVLEFDFLDDQEPPRQVTVGSGGSVQIPLLGPAKVEGLTIDEALVAVKDQFVQNKLLVDPKVTLAITTFRPVYVLGDVRSPGAFPYQASMTVERAVGVAGGLIAEQSTGEDRVMLRARLQGDLERLESEITREATWVARLTAQLAGRKAVETSDVPAEVQTYLNQAAADQFIAVENRILEAEIQAYESQASILALNLSETKKRAGLLERLRANQEKAIDFSKDELARANKLRKSGLNTAGDLVNVQQQLNSDEGKLLQILADGAETQRQAAALQLQLASLKDNRNRDALIQLQERKSALQRLYASYKTTQEQLALVANWASAMTTSKLQSVISFTIRQRSGAPDGDTPATGTTALLPGDVVIVSIARPDPEDIMESQ